MTPSKPAHPQPDERRAAPKPAGADGETQSALQASASAPADSEPRLSLPSGDRPAYSPGEGQHFASDNYAGMCPEALHWLIEANGSGHEPAYGDDTWTQRVCDRLRSLFEAPDAEVFFVFNGTAANSLALASLCQSYHSVVCSSVAHIETDECGGPEFFSNGSKLLVAETPPAFAELGKLTPAAVEAVVKKRSDIHYPKPKVLSITQSTELGAVYSVAEIRALTDAARALGLRVHMDGARFANAVAHLGVTPAELTTRAGIDVLCFGGTKNGLPVGEAVIFFNRALAEDFAYRVKQAGQLASKMRFISAPWLGLLEGDTWLRNATHANAMATRLHTALAQVPGVKLAPTPQANAVFVHLPLAQAEALRTKGWRFYDFIAGGGSRLMCAWDTRESTIDQFVSDLRATAQPA